ncbi:MAG TPA: phosphoglycerate dehydrogenase [Candidatus Ozemobacteraceae bacterium]|nr:phosphoglycerate dehydrogenase [Candidatus Ozemobacteraceae bacterium]
MSKILISTTSFDIERQELLKSIVSQGFQLVTNPYGRRLKETEAAELLTDDIVGMIAGVEPLTRPVLEGAKSLKVISRCGVGLDSVDLMAARERSIEVFNTPGAPVVSVAELTLSLILNMLRKVAQADRSIRAGEWKPLMGGLLAAQTIGVIGYGRIGKRVCQLLHAFGAKVLVYDKMETSVEANLQFLPMRELIRKSDVIALHLPYDEETRHLIDTEMLELMKPNAILVNTSRGGIIDEVALHRALSEKRIAGAALDVFEEEPYKGPLRELPNVLLTAHMGSYAQEARRQMEDEAVENLYKGLVGAGILAR